MNKKGELIGLSVTILILIIAGIVYYQEKIENKNYAGDTLSGVVYNLRSQNENCTIREIRIEKQNLRLFETREEAEGFILDANCN
ncbi:hypothetical protein KY361_06595 [Candidatus Woesearchaeota archaeon]|nr:hypothetical protein [Candidatus Woesearchaeota archaeon]